MIDLDATPAPDDGERIDLFQLDGVTYTIPARPRVNVALRYLRNAQRVGEDQAAGRLLEDLLGPEGWEALTEHDGLSPEDFGALMAAATKVTLGALEAAQGNSGRGR